MSCVFEKNCVSKVKVVEVKQKHSKLFMLKNTDQKQRKVHEKLKNCKFYSLKTLTNNTRYCLSPPALCLGYVLIQTVVTKAWVVGPLWCECSNCTVGSACQINIICNIFICATLGKC